VFEFTDAKVEGGSLPAEATAQVEKSSRQLVGTKGTGRISSTGQNLGADFELSASASPEARQALEGMRGMLQQIAAPMPEEAIGEGGKWRVEFTTDQMGIQIRQATTYTVKSIRGSKVDLVVEVDQKAASKDVAMPGLPPGVESQLESLTSKGGGTLALDLGALLPSSSQLTVDMAMQANLTHRGQVQPMNMEMTMNVSLTAK
jgi:hypothetical protein